MTEEEWLAPTEAGLIVSGSLIVHSPRKHRLLGCACVKWAWTWGLGEEPPPAVSVVEAFADGLATKDDLRRITDELRSIRSEFDESYRPVPKTYELTESLASEDASEVLGELHGYSADMFISDEPEWTKVNDFARDIFGNPFRPVAFDPRWRTVDSVDLARVIYEQRAFEKMPVLGDALIDAGCEDEQVITHCRGDGPHVRGCWVVDLVLGKE